MRNLENRMEDELNTLTLGKVFKWGVIVILFSFGLGLVGTFLSTIGTVVATPGKVITKTLDTNNIINSYEWYFDVNAAYNAKISQIAQYKNFYEAESDKSERVKLRTEMAAMQQVCRTLVEKYNADSQKMNKSIFKDWDLPAVLEQTNCNG